MAKIPNTNYDVFVTSGLTINFGLTNDPRNPPPPVAGDFNLEVVTNSNLPPGTFLPTGAGYNALAILSADGRTLTLAQGNYGVVDSGTFAAGAGNIIAGGVGFQSIAGAAGDSVLGGRGASEFIDAGKGNQAVLGGSGDNETIWGGAGDTIVGGIDNATIGGVARDTIAGGSGNQFIDASQGQQSIVGGFDGNQTIWGGAGDTIKGGFGGVNDTIGGAAGDTITGAIGFGTGNEFIDGSRGAQSITGGARGNETIWGGAGDTIIGGSAGNETIAGVFGETITGGSANSFIDATSGSESIVAGSGNTTVWGASGDTIQGAAGSGSATIAFGAAHNPETLWDNGSTSSGFDTVFNFNQPTGDRISLSNQDTAAAVVAGATSDISGNVVLHLHNGASITLIGVSQAMLNTGFFVTH